MPRSGMVLRRVACGLLAATLAACASSSTQRHAALLEEGAAAGFSAMRFGANPPLVGMLRHTPGGDPLWVVIEGDGRAWLSIRQPSSDPTPQDAVGWRLARQVGAPSVLYLARPCQFLSEDLLRACTTADWTDARFSEKWTRRLMAAVDEAKRATGARTLVLAGYSGGGVMAALMAARRDDVAGLVTVAAPLDVGAWTRLHGVTPLANSLDPVDARMRLSGLPQWHVSGGDDKVVPPVLLEDFVSAYPPGAPACLRRLPGVDHRMRTGIDLAVLGNATLPWPATGGQCTSP